MLFKYFQKLYLVLFHSDFMMGFFNKQKVHVVAAHISNFTEHPLANTAVHRCTSGVSSILGQGSVLIFFIFVFE